jgi:hypothetical protein
MSKLLQPGLPVPKRIFEGRYTMARREVVVEVSVLCVVRTCAVAILREYGAIRHREF